MLVGGGLFGLLLAGFGFAALRRQREAMRRAEQRVSFVNQVSHELRTPLTNIMLNSDLAADEGTGTGERQRRLGLIRDEASRLSRMIGNVLTFARGERGQLELQPVRCVPDEVVREVLEQFGSSLERRSIGVVRKSGAGEAVRLDRDALAQVLSNLVSNVEKYAGTGGKLEVETRLDGGELEIVVRDEGPGIPAGAEEKIFRPFRRLGSSVKEGVSGAGLGLAIARDLAERMGGTLECRQVEKGALFCLRVPAEAEPGNIVEMGEAVGE
jgi:signal transduction histidine kinase